MNIVYKTMVMLVNMGKMLPFVLCGIILVSYSETMFSLATSDFVEWGGYIIPNTPISWFVGNYFEYDLVTLFALLIMSIAVQTCFWNKLSLLYLFLQLKEKEYLLSIELLGVVPEDEFIITQTNKGEPAVSNKKAPSGKAYMEIARRLLGENVEVTIPGREKKGFLKKLFGK